MVLPEKGQLLQILIGENDRHVEYSLYMDGLTERRGKRDWPERRCCAAWKVLVPTVVCIRPRFSDHKAFNSGIKEGSMVTVNLIDSTTFEVIVEKATTTTHKVTLTAPYYEKLTGNRVPPEVLVEKSFRFLLDRESNTSILRSFDLPVIAQYFPEYERVIKGMLD